MVDVCPPVISATVSVGSRERKFHFHDAQIIRGMVEDVFGGKSYPLFKSDWLIDRKPKVIVDVGADIGAFSVYAWLQCPQATIHAFEPSSRALPLLWRNVKDLPVEVHTYGLDNSNRTETLHHSAAGYVADSINPCEYNSLVGSEQIELRDFAAEMRRLGLDEIDILKVDAEGCEVPILESMVGAGISPAWLYVEFHHEDDRRAIDELLRPTHKWYAGGIVGSHHRGEMLWIRNDLILPIVDRLAIPTRRKEVCA